LGTAGAAEEAKRRVAAGVVRRMAVRRAFMVKVVLMEGLMVDIGTLGCEVEGFSDCEPTKPVAANPIQSGTEFGLHKARKPQCEPRSIANGLCEGCSRFLVVL